MDKGNPWIEDYQKVQHAGPKKGESPKRYASYLNGFEVTAMVVVGRLRSEYSLNMADAWTVLRTAIGPHGQAFLREVELLEGMDPVRDDDALSRKVAKNIGIEMADAVGLVHAYRASKA